MAKRVQTVWIRRLIGAKVDDLRLKHREQFPGNELAQMSDDKWTYTKVALAIGAPHPTGADYTSTVLALYAAKAKEAEARGMP